LEKATVRLGEATVEEYSDKKGRLEQMWIPKGDISATRFLDDNGQH
jgi:hypothetical protein